ncbi:MAG: hypothetical protein JNG88_11195 [Phycisphaerales bacterium]|nr:hypothetical protein [Phycisphaerales bacterium]
MIRFAAATSLCVALAGCNPAAPSGSAPPPPVSVSLETPILAAVSALKVMHAEIRAHAAGDSAAAKAARGKLREISASKTLRDDLTKGRTADESKLAAAQNALLGSWVSTVMFYVDGTDFDKAELYSQTENRAIVRVPVHREEAGRKYHAALRVECVRQPEGTWNVSRVVYFGRKGESDPPMTTSQPIATITIPTSQHAPASDR